MDFSLSEEQLAELPKNVITRALGMQDAVVVDVRTDSPLAGDCYLLCSDGLNGMLTDEEIQEIIIEERADLDKAASVLIARANEKGGEDNITAVLTEIVEQT